MSNVADQPATRPAHASTPRGSLYSPLMDFLLLGGASIFILPLAALIPSELAPNVLLFTAFLSLIVNYPHFAHSYQIFYRDFANKLRGHGYPDHLRWRYAFAGLAVPVIIIAVFAVAYGSGNRLLLGSCVSAMFFFVGWHYVKQGYGMLIVDSVVNRSFFNEVEKKYFRINAYACWIFFFLLTSHLLREQDYLGLHYYFVPFPVWFLYVAAAAMAVTTVLVVKSGYDAYQRNAAKPAPINGYVAYVLSLYVWLSTYFSPAMLYVIPAFHSLQYLAVVWRYELNRTKAENTLASQQPSAIWRKLAVFIGVGIILGVMSFELVPRYLDLNVSFDKTLYGPSIFTVMIWVFINIHHYFLDNVMWRKDNPDVGKHLFGAR